MPTHLCGAHGWQQRWRLVRFCGHRPQHLSFHLTLAAWARNLIARGRLMLLWLCVSNILLALAQCDAASLWWRRRRRRSPLLLGGGSEPHSRTGRINAIASQMCAYFSPNKRLHLLAIVGGRRCCYFNTSQTKRLLPATCKPAALGPARQQSSSVKLSARHISFQVKQYRVGSLGAPDGATGRRDPFVLGRRSR